MLSREEIARVVGTIADLDGGQKRGFPEIAREIGVSERMVRKWRQMEAECPNAARLRLLELQAQRLATRLGEARQLLQEQHSEARARGAVLVPSRDDVRRARIARRLGCAGVRATDGAGDNPRNTSEVAA